MKQTIGFCGFCDAFRNMGRNENFSYEGKRILFDYLERLEEDTGDETELDVIALCCEYSEDDAEDIAANYMFYQPHGESEELAEFKALDRDEQIEAVREYLEENTVICGEHDGVFVYAQF